MAQLDDKINTTLDQVIATEWTGQGRGRVTGSLKKKSGALKGQGRQVRRASKGGGKGGNAGGGKGKDSSMPRGPRTKGFVKKTLFSTRRGTTAASRTSKGTVKGKSKGSRQRLAKGKGKGKGKGKWTGSDFDASGTGGRTLWSGGRSKGKARGKGKDTLSKWQGSGEGRSDKWKGTGNGRLKGKGKGKGKVKSRGNFQPSDGYGARRSIVKRQPGMRAGISGKGKGKGMSRAFAIATGRSLGRRGT